jgi:hypothetical protein
VIVPHFQAPQSSGVSNNRSISRWAWL